MSSMVNYHRCEIHIYLCVQMAVECAHILNVGSALQVFFVTVTELAVTVTLCLPV